MFIFLPNHTEAKRDQDSPVLKMQEVQNPPQSPAHFPTTEMETARSNSFQLVLSAVSTRAVYLMRKKTMSWISSKYAQLSTHHE